MVVNQATAAQTEASHRRQRPAPSGRPGSIERYPLDTAFRCEMDRFTRALSAVPNLPPAIPALGARWDLKEGARDDRRTPATIGPNRPLGVLHRRQLHRREKGGAAVGKTKRGKGTKLMGVADGAGLPIALYTTSASPNEVTLVEQTLANRFVRAKPKRLIADRAYDSDPLDRTLRRVGIELIAPHKCNRVRSATQDGRALRRYRRRWKIERLFAWLQNFRRVATRYEYYAENYLGFVQLACIMILFRHF